MSGQNDPQLTLVSTTDTKEAVQAALGVTPEAAAAVDAERAAEAPPDAPVTEEVKPAAEAPAVAAAPAAAEATTPETAKPARAAAKQKDSLQGRIDELVRERDTARGLTAAHEAELTALRAKVTELAGPAPPKAETPTTTEAPPEPKVEDFSDYDAFMKASIQYHARLIAREQVKEEMAAKATTEAQAQQQQAVTQILQQHEARVATAKERYDDFDDVVGKPDIQISTVMRDSIMISDVGPDVAYYLASHPEEREKIAALGNSPSAIRAMGKLEQKVETELATKKGAAASAPAATTEAVSTPAAAAAPAAKPAAPAAPAATKAPDPINPLGGGQVVTTVRPDQMSYADYKKWRAEQQLAAAGGRR